VTVILTLYSVISNFALGYLLLSEVSNELIRRPGFDSRHYQIFCGEKKKKNVVGLERGPLSLVITTEELLDRKVASPV
jgi:hypothetical protein